MTSALKIKANRANALAGTGPRTRQGKIHSAQNARRHGFSLSVLTDPLLSEEADSLRMRWRARGLTPRYLSLRVALPRRKSISSVSGRRVTTFSLATSKSQN